MLLKNNSRIRAWHIINNNALFIVVLIVVFIQLLISFQGFDLCDEGFSLSFYQQIYNAPESVEYNFVYWLSGLVGGLWYNLNENGGILWFRILAIIVNTTTFVVSFKMLVMYINKWYALIGITMVLFVNNFGYMVFYHNHLSALLAVSSMFFLIKGIVKNNMLFIGFSGLIFAVNIFTRIPNVLLGVFILSIPFYNSYLQQKLLSSNIKPMLSYGIGAILGLILIVVLLFSLDQFDIMERSLIGIINSGEAKDSNHNFMSLIKVNFDIYKEVISTFLKFTLVVFTLMFFFKRVKGNKLFGVGLTILTLILFFIIFKNNSINVLYGFVLFGTLGLIYSEHNNNIKLLSFLALMMSLVMPLGSDLGIYNIGYASIWLSVPLFFYFISTIKSYSSIVKIGYREFKFSISKYSLKRIFALLIISYFSSKMYSISQEAYFDFGSRFHKKHEIHSNLARGVYTTKERADITNELLLNIEKYVKPNDVLFAYDNIPMIHFLTKTKPYIYNPWVWIYDSYSFEKCIQRAEIEYNELPIIVQQKFETIYRFSKPLENYMSENGENSFVYNKGRNIVMNDFIKRNAYKIVWSNSYFNIYKSNKLKKQ